MMAGEDSLMQPERFEIDPNDPMFWVTTSDMLDELACRTREGRVSQDDVDKFVKAREYYERMEKK